MPKFALGGKTLKEAHSNLNISNLGGVVFVFLSKYKGIKRGRRRFCFGFKRVFQYII
jgi:hypothetical protein